MSDLLDQLLRRPAWQADAACNGSDTPQTAFFPGQNTGSNATAAARRLCNGCLVRTECLDFALANQIEFGVWGGTSENQRRTLRRTARWLASYGGGVQVVLLDKGGTITLKLALTAKAGGVIVLPKVTTVAPEGKEGGQFFFVAADGSLSRRDPNQPVAELCVIEDVQ